MGDYTRGTNVTLIGMPGSGKSTIGQLLAQRLEKAFLDGDAVIEATEGLTLQEIIDSKGLAAFREIEERVLSGLECENTVIAPGGSAIYYPESMAHLAGLGPVVYLHLDVAPLIERVTNMDSRGIAIAPGCTFEDLYDERLPLYQKFAGITVDCEGRSPEAIVEAIAESLR